LEDRRPRGYQVRLHAAGTTEADGLAMATIRVECLRCRHIGSLTEPELVRRGIKPDAPIVSFVKRLRCRKCGSQSVRVERLPQQRAS
jgi:phage FluMu protein Com